MENTMMRESSSEPIKTAAALRELLVKNERPGTSGRMNARERLVALFDADTFTEIGTYTMRRMSEFDASASDELESVLCGYGSVNGCLVYAFSQDMSRTKGSISEASAKKIASLYKLAIENGCPVVGLFDSAGAYLPEGVRALAGYGSIMKAVGSASGVIPQIAVVPGVAEGAAAIIASMFDFVIATENSKISVNPAFVVGGGTINDSVESGVASITVSTDNEALQAARELLSYLPSNNEEGTVEVPTSDEINRAADINAYDNTKSIVSFIEAAADDGKYIELNKEYAKNISVGFFSLNGVVCGAIGTNRAESQGKLTSKAARKAARFLSFCDSFFIPVITFVDTEGFEVCGEQEKNPFSSEIGKLASIYAMAKTPLITLVTGEAYGSAYTVLGSKAIGADLVLALENSKIGCMSAKSAVAFLWNNQISGAVTREALEEKWNNTKANVFEAAKAGEIDDIIEANEIRQRLASAVMMLAGKAAGIPKRRHANMPL